MPVPGFLTSFVDKAQSAINRPSASGDATQTGQPGEMTKNHTLEALQYQIRAIGQQYSSTSPVQKIITIEKGVAIDYDSVSRDCKAQSKELYTWGQTEDVDIKDVTDRLAFLNFVSGSLAATLASKINGARSPIKALRDAETALAPKRNARISLQNQIARLEHDQKTGYEQKVAELKHHLVRAEAENETAEKEVEIIKRKAVRESEQLKWEAIREYGEKLVLLSQAADTIISALPAIPPTKDTPYTGAAATGAARASLQRALDDYKTGHIYLPPQSAAADVSRSDTRSFGESHASELSSITTDPANSQVESNIPLTPPASTPPVSAAVAPINPAALNQSPAPIPAPTSRTTSPAPVTPIDPASPTVKLPFLAPTVAETGIPVASPPGPSSGSLHDLRPSEPSAISTVGSKDAPTYGSSDAQFESAAEEKKRAAAAYSGSGAGSAPSPTDTAPKFESAEEEKKRLAAQYSQAAKDEDSAGAAEDKDHSKEDELPPYQEP
ncbi:hypothetical protein FISHEDRAFT_75065 [Fistulina hepatica ATCC 64428]|uniref:Sphingolipid long chain base-responsive protein LSP1 n=1 Tax=Fistulina hepatica ATCC 64428 TaxID=1128425 RepID=A0A0D7A7P1_9AGAR|nr:hypothetical protein FISHEDRAFT_75065 [Fistulina hepatica ATCC 64428]